MAGGGGGGGQDPPRASLQPRLPRPPLRSTRGPLPRGGPRAHAILPMASIAAGAARWEHWEVNHTFLGFYSSAPQQYPRFKMGSTIDQTLLMQDTIMVVRRRHT